MMRQGGWLAIVAVAWAGGCTFIEQRKTARQEAKSTIEQERVARIQAELGQFNDFFQTTIDEAATKIERRAPEREQRKAALLWKVRMSSLIRGAAFKDDPAAGLVDTWAVCVRMVNYFEIGDGKSLFGAQQGIAQDAARIVEERIQAIAAEVVPTSRLAEMRASIDTYAREHPITGVFEQQTVEPISTASAGAKALGFLVGLPLLPIKAVGTLATGGSTFSDIKQVANRFTDVVEDLPASVRWQIQLLGIDLAESHTAGDFKEGFREVQQDLRRTLTTAEKLPTDIRQQGEALLDRLESGQPALQATLKEARETTAALNAVLKDARDVSDRIERTVVEGTAAAKAWQQTAAAVSGTVKDIGDLPKAWKTDDAPSAAPAATPSPPSRPFDINDWTKSAEAIDRAAGSTRALLADVEKVGVPKEVFRQLGEIDSQARALVDHIAIRAAQLVGLIFVLVIVYRWKISRLIAPRGA